jgi:phosphoserine phosphatase
MKLVLSGPSINLHNVKHIFDAAGLSNIKPHQVKPKVWVGQLPSNTTAKQSEAIKINLKTLQPTLAFDFAVLPEHFKVAQFKLLAMDMDSTLITIECIDEIADYIGKKAEVAAITAAAMRGEITSFSESLLGRVALLKGLDQTSLDAVYNERLKLSQGAESLLLLVSGGFTFFTDKLKERLGLDFAQANCLEIIDGKLTGQVLGPIVDAQSKADAVAAICTQLGTTPQAAIALGDGANDLKMMQLSGAGVACHAKPIVQEQTQFAINVGGLDTLVDWFEAAAFTA